MNVERTTLQYIGQETVRYVANINKYYLAYKLSGDLLEHRDDERSVLKEG